MWLFVMVGACLNDVLSRSVLVKSEWILDITLAVKDLHACSEGRFIFCVYFYIFVCVLQLIFRKRMFDMFTF